MSKLCLQGPANTPQNELFTFATYLYNAGVRGGQQTVSMFGPTIRVPADTNISLRLTNDLIGSAKVCLLRACCDADLRSVATAC